MPQTQPEGWMPNVGPGPCLIGWKEFVDFPEWGLRQVKVKIDTGARTSALGVVRYRLRSVAGVGLVADLVLALHRRHPRRRVRIQVPVLRKVWVRNTGGVLEERPLLEAQIQLGPVCKRILMTIADRSSMRFPIILGRKALEGDFLVDVGQKYLLKPK